MTLYPGAVDDGTTLPNPSSTSKTNSPSHASLHDVSNDAIKAVETKLGTGASTPVANTLLRGSGTGTSAWAALTSAQLAASISDETGSGAAVFATTPTLVTPKVDTINEATTSNGTTIGGVNIKSGALNTNNSVVTANITDNAVTASKLATNAITLASISSSTSQSGISTSDVLVTGLTTTVTIPAGGRKIRVEAYIPRVFCTAIVSPTISIYNSTTVTGTPIQTSKSLIALANNGIPMNTFIEYTPSPGSQSYCVALNMDAGSGSTVLASNVLAFLTVKVI